MKHRIRMVALHRSDSIVDEDGESMLDEDERTADVIEIGFEDIRFARDLRVHFDLERNGYVISAPEGVSEDSARLEDFAWHEKAFIDAEYTQSPSDRGPITFTEDD